MKLIIKSPKTKRIKMLLFISIFILIAIMLPFYNEDQEKPFSVFYILLGVSTIIWAIVNIYSNFAIKPFKIIGNVKFLNENIAINDIKIPVEKITLLEFRYINFGGKSTSFNSFSVTHGENNIILIKTDDGVKHKYNILLENKSDYIYIQKVFKAYADNGLKVSFYKYNKLIFKK